MTTPPHPHLPPRRRPPVFRPSFTLSLLYLVVFFFAFALLLILPELTKVLAEVPPGPEQEQIAREVAREAARPRLLYAVGLALGCLGLGVYLDILPGLKRR